MNDMNEYECFVAVELASFQSAASWYVDEVIYREEWTVLYYEESALVVDAH